MKEKFVCSECRHKFTSNFQPKLCPFCGKEKVESDISRGAQDIINDVLNTRQFK